MMSSNGSAYLRCQASELATKVVTSFPLKSELAFEVACAMFCKCLHSSLHIVRFQ
jgi:hypothetical protein